MGSVESYTRSEGESDGDGVKQKYEILLSRIRWVPSDCGSWSHDFFDLYRIWGFVYISGQDFVQQQEGMEAYEN